MFVYKRNKDWIVYAGHHKASRAWHARADLAGVRFASRKAAVDAVVVALHGDPLSEIPLPAVDTLYAGVKRSRRFPQLTAAPHLAGNAVSDTLYVMWMQDAAGKSHRMGATWGTSQIRALMNVMQLLHLPLD